MCEFARTRRMDKTRPQREAIFFSHRLFLPTSRTVTGQVPSNTSFKRMYYSSTVMKEGHSVLKRTCLGFSGRRKRPQRNSITLFTQAFLTTILLRPHELQLIHSFSRTTRMKNIDVKSKRTWGSGMICSVFLIVRERTRKLVTPSQFFLPLLSHGWNLGSYQDIFWKLHQYPLRVANHHPLHTSTNVRMCSIN